MVITKINQRCNVKHINNALMVFVALRLMIFTAALLIVQMLTVSAQSAPESFADLAEKVQNAVVNITVSTSLTAPDQNQGPAPMVPEGSPFEDFFNDFFNDQNRRPQKQNSLGAGFVVSPNGLIVTNNHVISGADKIKVEFFSGTALDATVVGTDPNTDIALLKVSPEKPLEFVSFGDSDVVRVGDWVMAVGNPLGQGFSVSVGIVSARNRALNGAYDDFIQTDAAINRGNSGGPLFNLDSEVIGVNTAILSPSGGSIGIGFSMSSAVVSRVVDQLKTYGETRRGWLGVQIQSITPELIEAWGLEGYITGVVVSDVLEGPASDAGIEIGDVIYRFSGHNIKDASSFVRMVGVSEVGKKITLEIYRDTKKKKITLILGRREEFERKAQHKNKQKQEESETVSELGLNLIPLNTEIRKQMQLSDDTNGLLIKDILPNSLASESGLQLGSVILKAGGTEMRKPADLSAEIAKAHKNNRKSIALFIFDNGKRYFTVLKLDNK